MAGCVDGDLVGGVMTHSHVWDVTHVAPDSTSRVEAYQVTLECGCGMSQMNTWNVLDDR